ncbi:carboxypeptidase B-like [Hetaerina americana]|uniref:carboxypeptidase B-like n=1 Tax=Hetaerina americana TaxID=62018 RepID=UPI003A7F3665
MSWRRYHRFKDIESYIDYLAHTYKEICETVIIGTSTEGRTLKVLKVSSGGQNKPAIWIDGGLHGREWISPATVTYILLQLVEFRDKHPHLLENLDWYILPVSNPDGYEYSHVHDRLWRKTRSIPVGSKKRRPNPALGYWSDAIPYSVRSQCVGVDPNRNWDFQWMKVGGSSNPCDDNFAGHKPFSEPETRAMADFIMQHKDQIHLFLSLHSYSQMWLIPWGWTDTVKPDDYYDMYVLAEKGVNALKAVRGTDYLLGTSAELIYASSGASDDWAKGVAQIKYAYTIELPDTGNHGFILPASQIESTGQETWEGVRALAQHFAEGYN